MVIECGCWGKRYQRKDEIKKEGDAVKYERPAS
jgi:hypothetical protein